MFAKTEILKGYKNNEEDGYWSTEKFLNMIYGLCGETNNQQMLFGGLQLLMDLTAIPATPKQEAIDYVMENTKDIPNMREDLAASLLLIYQDPDYIIQFIHATPPKPRQAINPKFMDIKKILIEHDCLKFAFNLMNSNSMQLKQLAMVLLIGLVGNYPDINEIKQHFGDTTDEKLQNGLRLVDALAGMGQEHLMRGDNEAAFGAFVEACKYMPRSPQLRYLTGKALAELGQIDNAKIEYSKAMNLSPAHAGPMPEATMAYCNLLIKYAKSKSDLEEAAEYLEMMIDEGTYVLYQTVEQIDIEDIYDRLCVCLEKLGKNDDALDRMLNLCKIKPNSHQIHFETGRLAILCKEYDLAREHLEFAISLEPFDMYAKYHFALSLFYLGDDDNINKAKDQILQILQNKPNDEKCQDLLAKIHIAQNNWEDALEIYQSQKENNIIKPYLQYQIGVVYENLKIDLAIESFENSTKIVGICGTDWI